MSIQYPTFQSDPSVKSLTASAGISSSLGIFTDNISISNPNFFASMELGSPSGAHIDLKRPYSDDYDIRLVSDNNIEGGGYLTTAGGAILTLSGSGVAINSYSPSSYKFLVNGGTRLLGTTEIGINGYLALYDNSTQAIFQVSNKQFTFYDSAVLASRMLIDTNGNVGIGTTSPLEKLHVVGNAILGETFNSATGYPASDLVIHAGASSNTLGQASAISIFREQTGPSWPQIATFTLGRFDAGLSPAPATRLDIDLKNSSDATDVADVTVMSLNSFGKVGIGLTNPAKELSVKGQISVVSGNVAEDAGYNGTIISTKTGSSNQHINLIRAGNRVWSLGFKPNDNTFLIARGETTDSNFGNNEAFSIDTDGKVGIGTVSPAARLDVSGTIKSSRVDTSQEGGQIELARAFDNSTKWYLDSYGSGDNSNLRIVDNSGSTALTVESQTRNIGIGTASPSSRLTVIDNSYPSARIESSFATSGKVFSSLHLGALAPNQGASIGFAYSSSAPANSFFHITPHGAIEGTAMCMLPNGSIGIGTTNPARPLQIGNESGQQIARIAGGSAGTSGGSAIYFGAGTSDIFAIGHYSAIMGGTYNDAFTLFTSAKNTILNPAGGNVGIATATPTYKLDVAGTGRFTSNVEITGTLKAITELTASNISSSGNITTGGNIVLSNAGGITFGTTAGGSGTPSSQTLSDYEVGTWTPTMYSSLQFTASVAQGTYIKIGRKVFVQCEYWISNTGSATGAVYMGGLPFACSNNQRGILIPTSWYAVNSSLGTSFNGRSVPNNSTLELIRATAGGITGIQTTNMANGAQFHFNGNYETSS
jgi:hypothetical protein